MSHERAIEAAAREICYIENRGCADACIEARKCVDPKSWQTYAEDARAAIVAFPAALEVSEAMALRGTNTLGEQGVPISTRAAKHCWRAMCSALSDEVGR